MSVTNLPWEPDALETKPPCGDVAFCFLRKALEQEGERRLGVWRTSSSQASNGARSSVSPPRLSFPPQEKQKTGPQAASFQNPRFPSGRAWDGRAPHTPRLTGLAFSRRCPLLPANQAPSLVPFSAVGPKLRAPSPSAQARPWVKLPTRSAAHSGKAWNEVLASLVFLSETERERERQICETSETFTRHQLETAGVGRGRPWTSEHVYVPIFMFRFLSASAASLQVFRIDDQNVSLSVTEK